MRVSAVRLDGERGVERVAPDEGFYCRSRRTARRRGVRRVGARRRLHVADGPVARRSRCGCRPSHRGRCACSPARRRHGARRHDRDVGRGRRRRRLFDVINNAGSDLYQRGFGGDRGFLERDDGQYELPAEVFAWCGERCCSARVPRRGGPVRRAAVPLLRGHRPLVAGPAAGWRYRYVPDAVVRHRHAAVVGRRSPTFRFYTERNRLLVLAKNAPARLALERSAARSSGVSRRSACRAASADAADARARRGGTPMACAAQLRRSSPAMLRAAERLARRGPCAAEVAGMRRREHARRRPPHMALRVGVYDLYW